MSVLLLLLSYVTKCYCESLQPQLRWIIISSISISIIIVIIIVVVVVAAAAAVVVVVVVC